jgi:hypothetical protein
MPITTSKTPQIKPPDVAPRNPNAWNRMITPITRRIMPNMVGGERL